MRELKIINYLFISVIFFLPHKAWGANLSYVFASSELEGTKAGEFWAGHAFDGNSATAWCEGASGSGEKENLLIAFKKPVSIDAATVTVGFAKNNETFSSHGVVKGISVATENFEIFLQFKKQKKPQTIHFEKPLRSHLFKITITEIYKDGEEYGLSKPACISDIKLISKKRALTGRGVAHLLRFKPLKTLITGDWLFGPEGSPTKVFIFCLDRTFIWIYSPLGSKKETRITGRYTFNGEKLLLARRGGAFYNAKFSSRKKEVGKYFSKITIDCPAIHPQMAKTQYRIGDRAQRR